MTESSELPLPQQPRESEAVRERPSIFQRLRDNAYLVYLASTLALLPGSFKHERIEAAEIPPDATWSDGVKTLRNEALSEKGEKAGVFYTDFSELCVWRVFMRLSRLYPVKVL